MSSVLEHWTQNVEEFHRSPESFLTARNITGHNFVLDILEVSERNLLFFEKFKMHPLQLNSHQKIDSREERKYVRGATNK